MKRTAEEDRILAVGRFLGVESAQAICDDMGRSMVWLYKWLKRYDENDPEWFYERSRCPGDCPSRLPERVEEAIKLVRLSLYNQGVFCGGQAIRWELEGLEVRPLPSVSTINRILRRHGLTHRRTGRYEPKGTPYPSWPIQRPNQRHQADLVGPRHLKGALRFYSLNAVDLATGRCGIEPVVNRKSQSIIDGCWALWWRLGMPDHLQVDNDTCFYGNPSHPRGMGALLRLCLLHGVQLWFIPESEPWRNGVVEKMNMHYQQKLLAVVKMGNFSELLVASHSFEKKHNDRYRYSKLGGKTPSQTLDAMTAKLRWPPAEKPPRHPLLKPETGQYHLIRFIRSDLCLTIFGEKFKMPPELEYTYVIATVDVQEQKLKIFQDQRQIEELEYKSR